MSDRVSIYSRALLACFAHLPIYQGLRTPYLRVLHDKMDGRGSQRTENLELNSGLRKLEGRWMPLGLHIDVPRSFRDGCVGLRGPGPGSPMISRGILGLVLDLGLLLSLCGPGWGLSLN